MLREGIGNAQMLKFVRSPERFVVPGDGCPHGKGLFLLALYCWANGRALGGPAWKQGFPQRRPGRIAKLMRGQLEGGGGGIPAATC